MEKIKKLWLPILVIIQVINVMFLSYLHCRKFFSYRNVSRVYIGLLIFNLIIIIIMTIKKKMKKEKMFNRFTDIILVFIIIFSLISASLAIHKQSAFFGFSGRYEGFFQIMYYFTLVTLSSFVKKEEKKYVVYAILACGAIEAVYSIFQKSQLLPVATQFQHEKPWATGFITNPNFFGTFMLLCLSYSISLFFDIKKKLIRVLILILIILFMIGLLLSDTLSVIVGLVVVIIYLVIYTIVNKRYKDLLILIVVIISTFFAFSKITGSTVLLKDIAKTKDQIVEMSKGHVEDEYGTKRIYIWKRTLWVLPNYIWHGAGIDNFNYAFGTKPLTMNGWLFDKAHNEYLQILICEGIFALISYLLFFGTIAIRGIIKCFKNKELLFVLPVIGYLVQAFFNISVIEVAPFFYIALGLCIDREGNKGIKVGIIRRFFKKNKKIN